MKDSNELTMDELGEITDYMYETSSEDALIIRGLSQDPNLGENISVTVIATGFPSNSILTPYKKPKPQKSRIAYRAENPVPAHVIPDKGDDSFSVHQKSPKSLISNIDEEMSRVSLTSILTTSAR